jgi:transcriptional regulator with XRE-family HTH domain
MRVVMAMALDVDRQACDTDGMAGSVVPLLMEARRALGGISQGELGVLLGASRRTGQRWEGSGATPSTQQLHDLARRVYSKDAKLAADIAAEAGSSLEALGIVPAALPAPPPAATPAPPAEDVVDAVVCAAADAIDVLPRAVRPALLAAFTRARRLGLSVEAVESALNGKGEKKETRTRGKAKR